MSFSPAEADAIQRYPSPEAFSKANVGLKAGCQRLRFSAGPLAKDRKAAGTYGLGLTLPAGSIVKWGVYRVNTTFASATDAATIALQVEAADDLVTAVAISDGGNPWDAGNPVECTPDNTVANFVVLTAEREVSAVVATETLTAGELDLWVEYWVPDTNSF